MPVNSCRRYEVLKCFKGREEGREREGESVESEGNKQQITMKVKQPSLRRGSGFSESNS